MHHHLLTDCGTFYHTAVRCQIAGEYRKASGLAVRIFNRADNLWIPVLTVFNIFAHSLSCHCHTVQIQQIFFGKLIHHCIHTAGLIQIFNVSRTCRCQMAEIRCLCAHFICKGNVKVPSDFMGNCRQMQHTVGRTSKCHINRQGIHDRVFCHDVPRTDILSVHLHYLHTCVFCQFDPLGINSRDGSISF